jgi:hypothetical protein
MPTFFNMQPEGIMEEDSKSKKSSPSSTVSFKSNFSDIKGRITDLMNKKNSSKKFQAFIQQCG